MPVTGRRCSSEITPVRNMQDWISPEHSAGRQQSRRDDTIRPSSSELHQTVAPQFRCQSVTMSHCRLEAEYLACFDGSRGMRPPKLWNMSTFSGVDVSSSLGGANHRMGCGVGGDWSELVASYRRMKSAWGWAIGGQPILVCYIRKYVIILGGIFPLTLKLSVLIQ